MVVNTHMSHKLSIGHYNTDDNTALYSSGFQVISTKWTTSKLIAHCLCCFKTFTTIMFYYVGQTPPEKKGTNTGVFL